MDIRKVKKLIELLEESGIAEIEITEGEEAVRITRYSNPAPAAAPAVTPPPPPATQPIPTTEPETAAVDEGQQIVAPMVGTFYRAPDPTAEPFVNVGDEIEVGDTLCIVEAMKMMNQIEAEVTGRILSIEVENGAAVEFGQVLFIIG